MKVAQRISAPTAVVDKRPFTVSSPGMSPPAPLIDGEPPPSVTSHSVLVSATAAEVVQSTTEDSNKVGDTKRVEVENAVRSGNRVFNIILASGGGTPSKRSLHDVIMELTNPDVGPYPTGISPKQLYRYILNMPEKERNAKSRSQLQVQLFRAVRQGIITHLSVGLYTVPEYVKPGTAYGTNVISCDSCNTQDSPSSTDVDAAAPAALVTHGRSPPVPESPDAQKEKRVIKHRHSIDGPHSLVVSASDSIPPSFTWPRAPPAKKGRKPAQMVVASDSNISISGGGAKSYRDRDEDDNDNRRLIDFVKRGSRKFTSSSIQNHDGDESFHHPSTSNHKTGAQSCSNGHCGTVSAWSLPGGCVDDFEKPFHPWDLTESTEFRRAVPKVASWSVESVGRFIAELGFPREADAFKREKVDGQALLLLRKNDVMSNLSLKLGPAVKIYWRIATLQDMVSKGC